MPRLHASREQEAFAESLASDFDTASLLVLRNGSVVVHGFNENGQPVRPALAAQHLCIVGDDGEAVTVKADARGFAYWSDDWTRIDEFVAAGALRVREGGPGTYGHRDFFVAS